MSKKASEAQVRRHLGFAVLRLEMCTKLCGLKECAGARKKRKESSGGALWAAATRQVDRFTKYRLGNKYCKASDPVTTVIKSLSTTFSTS